MAQAMERPTGAEWPLTIVLGEPNSAVAAVGAFFCFSNLTRQSPWGATLAAANSGSGALLVVLDEALGLPLLVSSQGVLGLPMLV